MRLEDWEFRRSEIASAQIVMIWRAPHSAATASIMRTAREAGAKVVFDLDDLMLKPELARVDVIDGIRSQNFSADESARLFARIQKALLKADICTCTTNELADHIREYQKSPMSYRTASTRSCIWHRDLPCGGAGVSVRTAWSGSAMPAGRGPISGISPR